MQTIQQSLKSISSYPVPTRVYIRVCTARGLDIETDATADVLKGKAYQLAEADVMDFLTKAPNVSEGGVTFSLTDAQRSSFQAEANSIYNLYSEPTRGTTFGNKGEDF